MRAFKIGKGLKFIMYEAENSCELSKEEAENLLIEYKKSGDKSLLDKLVYHYRYIPELLSRRYAHRGVEYEDIYQIACLGLFNAIERYDAAKGIKFITFATPTIIGEIKRFFRDKGNFIKVPRKIYETFQKANKLRNAYAMPNGGKISSKELAEAIGVTEEELLKALSWGDGQFVRSLEQFVYADDDDKTFTDIIGVEDNHFLMIENSDFIEKFMEKLDDKEKRFVYLRFEKELSQTEISKQLGISQMTVSRMEKRILNLLKNMYFEAMKI